MQVRFGAAVAAVALIVTVGLSAQPGGPRFPSGPARRHDIEGFWTNSTATPLQRPRELAEKPFFTEQGSRRMGAHRNRSPREIAAAGRSVGR